MHALIESLKKSFVSFRKHDKAYTLSDYKRKGIRPSEDWLAMLYSIAVLLVVTALAATAFTFAVRNDSIWTVPAADTVVAPTLNQKSFDQVTGYFTNRSQNANSVTIPSDPSL